jgi:hypothetical protein
MKKRNLKISVSIDLAAHARRANCVPPDWSDELLRSEVTRYLKFLLLAQLNPGVALAPTKGIDVIWHAHMLAPRVYALDCQRLFGQVLDHDGGFGSTPEELPILKQVFQKTAELWQQTYGEPYVAVEHDPRVTNCWHDCQGRCWHACSNNNDDDERSPSMFPSGWAE